MDLSTSHKHHLLLTFEHVDELLTRVQLLLAAGRSSGLFKSHIQDITPEKRKALDSAIAQFRSLMAAVLAKQDIAPRPPHVSALRAVLSSFTFADIALEELSAKYMRGYGELAPGVSEELDMLAAQLREAFRKVGDILAEPPAGDGESDAQ
jgi:hypothetical protein